jgi:hypothetical protein
MLELFRILAEGENRTNEERRGEERREIKG